MTRQTLQLPASFARYRADIDGELRSAVNRSDLALYDMLNYHFGWVDGEGEVSGGSTGKALRPTLCLLVCEANGGDYRKALPAAAAIELVHNYSLVHDDIQDDDRERHHRPTVWSVWGKPQAINAGSALRSLAGLAMLGLVDRGVAVESQIAAQRLLEESCLRMIEGQYLDISYETRFDVTVADYLDMVGRKTAALMGCAAAMGALLSVGEGEVMQGFRRWGENLGLAYQMQDDILGIWGDERDTGKSCDNDIRRRKKSLPVVYALEKASPEDRAALAAVFGKERLDESDAELVLRRIDALGARPYAEGLARAYSERAAAEVGALDLPLSWREEVTGITRFFVERSF